ncbi:MAG TPA: hypothetical protein VFQ51_06825, partial [Vicinamibacteria bacterium]|nr:hypothetical protein [Vicinamibacteria bacterium]
MTKECERHLETLAQARQGRTDAHVSECARCQDSVTVADALAHLSTSAALLPAPAADARFLLHRSRFVARLQGEQRRAMRSERPLVFAQVVGIAVMAAALGWALLGGGNPGALADAPSS